MEMLKTVWFPIVYFKLSFGTQDQLAKHIACIQERYCLDDSLRENEVASLLLRHSKDEFLQDIFSSILRYVPYRFVRPWFDAETSGLKDAAVNKVISDALLGDDKGEAPYQLDMDAGCLVMHPHWDNWISCNAGLLEGHVLFELTRYLERNNPHVSSISRKMFRPKERKLVAPTSVWKQLIEEKPKLRSVFELVDLASIGQPSLDHFLPWSFVAHDQLWNLHPTTISANSSKGNKLPHSKYVHGFSNLQYEMFLLIRNLGRKEYHDYRSFLLGSEEDYFNRDWFVENFKGRLANQMEVASGMGFQENWVFPEALLGFDF